MLEILAPAGNAECADAAINHGANAIYLGYSSFSARQSAENFDGDALRAVIQKAHLQNVKVYVAMNTLVKDKELDDFIQTLLFVWNQGVDAVIMQDILLGYAIHQRYPEIVLHLSTQAGVCTIEGAKMAKKCGFTRVILARETPLKEIEQIAAFIEMEVFVQGALCTCFSGQCYFSSFAGGNSGNRGRCKQPCRKLYAYDRNGNTEKSYALSLSDLSVGEEISKLIQAGVVSFKIEGRMRRAEYVAAAVRYYRALLDGEMKENAQKLSDLKRVYNRGNYTKGLAFGQDKRFLSPFVQGHLGEKVGTVKVLNGKYFVDATFKPTEKDAFKILREGKEVGGAFMQKQDKKGFWISSKCRLKNGDGVFITTDQAVNNRLLSVKKQRTVHLSLVFHEGELAYAESEGISFYSKEKLQSAENRFLTKEELMDCFLKTDGAPFEVVFDFIDLNGKIFIPKSLLNAFRREFYELLIEKLCKKERTAYAFETFSLSLRQGGDSKEKTAVIATTFEGVKADVAIYKADDLRASLPKSFLNGTFEKYIYYPPFCTAHDVEELSKRIQEGDVDGIYAENYGGLIFAQEHGLRVFAGTGLHVFNQVSLSVLLNDFQVEYYAISKEANLEEMQPLMGKNAFVLSMGDIKLMDLIYCPFGKTCSICDKKAQYILTDENDRKFPVRRYVSGAGECRFEVYNCANLIGKGVKGANRLVDFSITADKQGAFAIMDDETSQKQFYKSYTSGHFKRGVL